MDEETGRRVCSIIAGVLCADGEMGVEERAFLKRVMQHVGIETDTALMPTYGDDIAEELAQLPEAARWETLDMVIAAAAADGQFKPAERAFVDIIAKELGVDEADVVARMGRALDAR
jgi:uncharacterized tellurite resistance protein B-like protein